MGYIGLIIICMALTMTGVLMVDGNDQSLPSRKKVAVQGIVHCLDCTLNNHSQLVPVLTPVAGAILALQCNNTFRKAWESEIKSDGNGEFLFKTNKVTSWGAHKCKLFLLSSPHLNCSSTGNPYPEPDGSPWIFGRSLIKLNATKEYQFYQTDSPLFFYPHWSACT